MRLIENGALDGQTVEEVAARLGIGPRHLNRLFRRYLDAGPIRASGFKQAYGLILLAFERSS
jgi:AraC family transcriptional regulator, regulatory protein of adaptative response / methylated-DNA-[protein]-cysteine methyltransferase